MKTALFALALSCFQAYGTAVCSETDAVEEALDRWGGQVTEVDYNPDRNGYDVRMIDRRGRRKKRFVDFDCSPPPPSERDIAITRIYRLERRAEEYEQQAEELEQQAEELRRQAEELRQQAEELRQHIEQD